MLGMESRAFGFRTQTIWFADEPYDIADMDSICFLACKKKMDLDGFEREDLATIIIDLKTGTDAIWNDFSSKCRSSIKKAEKEGVEVKVDRDYEGFIELNENFREEKGLTADSRTPKFMKEHGVLLTAYHQGELVSGVYFVKDEKHILGLLAASKRLEVDSERRSTIANANRMLFWEGMRYGVEKGMELYDLGGYYVGTEPDPEKERINEFKRRFGGTVVDDFIYRKDYSLKMRMARKAMGGLQKVRSL
jgi:lipid II:glycine glycyltransferase (peptidoglycan interpeptide bridge formation enzyme)